MLARSHQPTASVVAMFFSLLITAPALAASPSIQFDFDRAIACRVVEVANPDELLTGESKQVPNDGDQSYEKAELPLALDPAVQKLIEFTLPLSVQLRAGDPGDLREVRVEVSDYDRRLKVHRFSPMTRLESQLTSDIVWSKTTESNRSLHLTLGGEAPLPLGDIVAHVTPSASGKLGGLETISEQQLRRPPKQVVVASGTISERHGVFFHLKPTPQTTLEGVHQLRVTMIAPANWRGDALRVSVSAEGTEQFLWMEKQKTVAHRSTSVALYLAGDQGARTAALRYLRQ